MKNSSPKNLLADCRLSVSQLLANSPPTVNPLSFTVLCEIFLPTISGLSADTWQNAGDVSANCRLNSTFYQHCFTRNGKLFASTVSMPKTVLSLPISANYRCEMKLSHLSLPYCLGFLGTNLLTSSSHHPTTLTSPRKSESKLFVTITK